MSYQDTPHNPAKQGLVAMHQDVNNWETACNEDTGATHHFTNDTNTLILQKSDYTGAHNVKKVRNGQGLQISKTGSSILSNFCS